MTTQNLLARRCPSCGKPFDVVAIRSYPLLCNEAEFIQEFGHEPNRFSLVALDAQGNAHCSWDRFDTRVEADEEAARLEDPERLEALRQELDAEAYYQDREAREFWGDDAPDDPHDDERPEF